MDLLLSFFILIIATIIGIAIGLRLEIKSYLKIAIIVIWVFIPMELYSELVVAKKANHIIPRPNSKPNAIQVPIPNSQPNSFPNSIPYTTMQNSPSITNTYNNTYTNTSKNIKSDNYPVKDDANNRFAREKDLIDTKYSIFKKKNTDGEEKDALPLDGLSPSDLLSKLTYITYATANPYKPITYTDFKGHADKYLNEDNTKLSAKDIDPKLLSYSRGYYPQLSSNQIDQTDCLNSGSSKDSCFQSAQLFSNVKNNFNILGKGVNEDNSNLIIREDFSNPMILNPNSRYEPIVFKNAPNGNLDRIIDNESNESINLDESDSLCRSCKLSVCKSDYCSLQKNLFM